MAQTLPSLLMGGFPYALSALPGLFHTGSSATEAPGASSGAYSSGPPPGQAYSPGAYSAPAPSGIPSPQAPLGTPSPQAPLGTPSVQAPSERAIAELVRRALGDFDFDKWRREELGGDEDSSQPSQVERFRRCRYVRS